MVAPSAERLTRVLVLVKASPQPSRQYGDTVCVAGVDLESGTPRWLRLYPVPFRYLDGDSQFRKYDVIEVRTRDAGADKRPESRKIAASTIRVGGRLATWQDRDSRVAGLDEDSMCDLIAAARTDVNARSLAAVRPARVRELDFAPHPGWSSNELARFEAYRNQGDLFREQTPRLLDPPRLIVRLSYDCSSSGCRGHTQRIIDWELSALQRRFRGRPTAELERAIARNFHEIPFGTDRAPLIFVGNQENVRRRASFTILGLYYPKKSDLRQRETLF